MSNALIVDNVNEPGNTDQLKADLRAAGTTPESKPNEEAPKGEEIPDKYRGKAVEDVIDMHRNAESALGRTNNELGQYKKLTDQLLDLKRHDDLLKGGADEADIEEVTLPEISSTDMLDNPTDAISKVVDARLTADSQKRDRDAAEAAALEDQREFAEKHPDAGQIANDPKFVEWVSKSPTRLRAARAAYEGEFGSGSDLLDEWKALSTDTSIEDSGTVEEDANLEAARKAGTISAGSTQTTDAPKGKVYRRLDLIRLKIEDPEAYADPGFQQEIVAAYNEGRVK